jgi:hypothetical protein
MTEVWMPGATVRDVGDHAPTSGGPAKAIAHITWDRNASAASPADLVPYENLASYFSGSGASVAPHILWDPFTGRFTQFFPADSRSKSLVDQPGGTRTNRAGSVVIQIEALFFPYCRTGGKVYAKLSDTPCKGWSELHDWIKSFGVPDAWPMGKPVDFTSNRSETVWETRAGWYGHQQVPENTHQDPGSWPDFPSGPASAPKPTPVYAPFPGAGFFHIGQRNPLITAMGKRLVAEGYTGYSVGPGPEFTRSDLKAYAWWQRKLGYSGSSADGYPGPASWAKLKVPKP